MSNDDYDADDAAWGESDRRYEENQRMVQLLGTTWKKDLEERQRKEEAEMEAEFERFTKELEEQRAKPDKERIEDLELTTQHLRIAVNYLMDRTAASLK